MVEHGLGDCQFDRKKAARSGQALQLTTTANHPAFTRWTITGEVAVVILAIRFGHQHFYVLSDRLLVRVFEHPDGRRIDGDDLP